MQMAWQLSIPGATEEERDLLRREYRLIQAASEFWVGFDSLNVRIHGAAELVRVLRSQIEESSSPEPRSPLPAYAPLPSVEPPPMAAARLTALPVQSKSLEWGSGMRWGVSAGALGLLVMILRRLRSTKERRRAFVAPQSISQPVIPAAASGVGTAAPLPHPPPVPEEEGAEDHERSVTPRSPEETPGKPDDAVHEELDHALDLAAVMMSHGRTTGAIQALKDYMHDHPTVSVRPWLNLLELYRQTGLREEFELAAESVHFHFNVKMPGWDEGVTGVPLRSFFDDEESSEILGLEQLPHILTRIQATWPDASCLEYLRHLLVDNREGGRIGFPVSVVAEIILLEDILNDRLAGHASQH